MGARVTIKEAVKHVGRSERTIRKWLADERLTAHRVEGDRRKTVFIDTDELLMAAADMTSPPTMKPRLQGSKGEVAAIRQHLEATEKRLETSERRFDKAEQEGRELRAEVARLREALAAKAERIHALELELNGGVRGLLRRFSPMK